MSRTGWHCSRAAYRPQPTDRRVAAHSMGDRWAILSLPVVHRGFPAIGGGFRCAACAGRIAVRHLSTDNLFSSAARQFARYQLILSHRVPESCAAYTYMLANTLGRTTSYIRTLEPTNIQPRRRRERHAWVTVTSPPFGQFSLVHLLSLRILKQNH
ncbi:hypothetical protein J6590_013924 [Homalodisca vitripennis]|nr:hypothetical protein J6590_013924 [Homalodisca vitripennis]